MARGLRSPPTSTSHAFPLSQRACADPCAVTPDLSTTHFKYTAIVPAIHEVSSLFCTFSLLRVSFVRSSATSNVQNKSGSSPNIPVECPGMRESDGTESSFLRCFELMAVRGGRVEHDGGRWGVCRCRRVARRPRRPRRRQSDSWRSDGWFKFDQCEHRVEGLCARR